jgi:hypothetical protein
LRVALCQCLVLLALLGPGCATYDRQGLDPAKAKDIELTQVRRDFKPSVELQKQILALNPASVSAGDIRDVLSQCPAPRIVLIHGGIAPVQRRLISFSEFLMGMGYPGISITNPGDGTYTFSCYESSKKIAGVIAWYYEREALRPVLIGHSQGGMQVVKVLHHLAGPPSSHLHLWNPLTWQEQTACDFRDPLTGQQQPVVGLRLPYASALGAGGLTRFLPNQWDMFCDLREIPDSVEEFTGFYKHNDLLGGDFLGYGPANHYHAEGQPAVRNIRLPSSYEHGSIPDTRHLLNSTQIMDWINKYQPDPAHISAPKDNFEFEANSRNILWAAEVWYSLKKHWVLELQRFVRARQSAEAHS